jgi:hypothetical protein
MRFHSAPRKDQKLRRAWGLALPNLTPRQVKDGQSTLTSVIPAQAGTQANQSKCVSAEATT